MKMIKNDNQPRNLFPEFRTFKLGFIFAFSGKVFVNVELYKHNIPEVRSIYTDPQFKLYMFDAY